MLVTIIPPSPISKLCDIFSRILFLSSGRKFSDFGNHLHCFGDLLNSLDQQLQERFPSLLPLRIWFDSLWLSVSIVTLIYVASYIYIYDFP